MIKHTIAIADDNSTDILLLKNELEETGKFLVVFCAYNGAELIKFLNDSASKTELLIIDLYMPILSGLETIRFLKSANYTGKIIGVTYGFSKKVHQQLKYMEIDGFCQKIPQKVTTLAQKILSETYNYDESEFIDWEKRSIDKNLQKLDEDQILNSLSSIELRILKNLAKGLSSNEIGPLLGLGGNTINQYKSRILQKLNLKNDKQLVAFAFIKGISTTNDFYSFAP